MDAVDSNLDSCKWIYLRSISEPSDNTLRLVIEEAASGGAPDPAGFRTEPSPELAWILAESTAIAHGPECRVFLLYWPNYIAYSVRNESYVSQDEYEEGTGRLFVQYSKSRYMDFVSSGTFAAADYPGPFNHWGINCLNHIIDVVSTSKPIIEVYRA